MHVIPYLMLVLGTTYSSVVPTVAVMIGVTLAPIIFKDFLESRAQRLSPEERIGKATRRFRPAVWIYVICLIHAIGDPGLLILVIQRSHATAAVWIVCALAVAGIVVGLAFVVLRIRSSYVQIEPDLLEFRWADVCTESAIRTCNR